MVVTVALRLLAGFESTSWASTVAALVIGPPSLGAVTVRVMVATAALLSVPPVQLAVLVVVLNTQLKPPPLALTAVMVAPSGWSVTWIWVAVLGLRLVTGFESTSWASTVAALVIGPPSLGAVTVRVMVATAALPSVPPVQLAV